MKFCSNTIDPDAVKDEQRASVTDPPQWLQEFFGGGVKSAGVNVNEITALSASAVFGCVRNIAEDLAKLPLLLYRRIEGGGKERFPEHPIYRLLHDNPNPEMTAFDFRQAVTAAAVLWGGGYAEIETTRGGDPAYLWPLEPWRVRVDRDSNKRLVYIIDGRTTLASDEVMHLKGFSITGIVGLMIASTGRDSLGLTLAAQKFAASFFANGMNLGGMLEHPGKLSDQARGNLRKSWETVHSGPDNANKLAILEEGLKFNAAGSVQPNDGQLIETRQFQIEDVARWFRMPPHKIQHLLRSTFGNIEHQAIEYVTDTIMPWAVKWEQEISKKLLADERDIFAEHLMDALLRGDSLSRSQALQIQFQNGVINDDEWRSIENRNPLPNGTGKTFFVPMNMTTIERAISGGPVEPAAPAAPPPAMPASPDAAEVREALSPLLDDIARRICRREEEVLRKSATRGDFAEFAPKFYDEHRSYVRNAMLPLVQSYVASMRLTVDSGAMAAGIADGYCKSSADSVREPTDMHLDEYSAEQVSRIVAEFRLKTNGVTSNGHRT